MLALLSILWVGRLATDQELFWRNLLTTNFLKLLNRDKHPKLKALPHLEV